MICFIVVIYFIFWGWLWDFVWGRDGGEELREEGSGGSGGNGGGDGGSGVGRMLMWWFGDRMGI